MSAAESERVEVDVAPSEFVDEDADDAGAGEAATSSSGRSRSSIFEMLQSTEPRESPEQQDGTLSTNAEWHQHAELAMKKATGSDGAPAWVNFLMSFLLLAASSAGLDLGEQAESSSSESTSTPDEQPTQDLGTPVGTNGETTIIGAEG